MSNMTDEQSQLIEHVNKRIILGVDGNTYKHHRVYVFHKLVFKLSPP